MPAPTPHTIRERVRYVETDQGGIVHHSNYLHWFEVGRTAWLRDLGVPYEAVEREHGLVLAVVETSLLYRAPARYGDEVVIETRLTALRRVGMRLDSRILHAREEHLLCEGFVRLACIEGGTDRVRGLPADLAEVLKPELARASA